CGIDGIGGLKPSLQSFQTAFFAFFGRGRQMKRVIPAQAGIRVCRCGNLSGKKVSQVLSPGFPLSRE
ncbi:TPA: hypothetical protein ACMW10_001996, partial [Neisseria gonorrhoeae]